MASDLPEGLVTFLLTDIEGSTRQWEANPAGMQAAQARLDEIFDEATEKSRGVNVRAHGEGDSAFLVFPSAADAVACAIAVQRAVGEERWPAGAELRVRMALHTGQAELRADNYFGTEVNRCARLRALGHGGQVLLSQATADHAGALPEDADLADLGVHRLRDLSQPERVFQLRHPALRSRFPPLVSHLPRTSLPAPLSSFVGREKDLTRLADLLRESRLVTLMGPGGMGKTRLALALAARVEDRYESGARLVELAPLVDDGLVAAAFASALGVVEQPGSPLADTVLGRLAAESMLLVVDNCEHLAGTAADLVERILRAAPSVRVVATSREPLGVPGEVLWRVGPLGLPESGTEMPEDLLQYEAVRLLLERAFAADPDFALTAQNAADVAQVCRRLDGIPLALELAAARLRMLDVDQLVERLDDLLGLPSPAARTAAARHQTLRATVQWSYELLDPHERLLLERLSVFAGGFSLEAAEAVCGYPPLERPDVVAVLSQLEAKSLVVAERLGGTLRYGMLQAIRQFAAEHLESAGATARARSRHLEWALSVATEADTALQGPDQGAWLDRLERDHDEFRSALAWAAGEGGRPIDGLLLALGIWRFWHVRGHFDEGRATVSALLDGSSPDPLIRSKALDVIGTLSQAQGDLAAAKQLHEESLGLAREADEASAVARALHSLGNVCFFLGEYDDARPYYEESLELSRSAGDEQAMARLLHNLGVLARMRCDYRAARPLYEESLEIARRLGNTRSIAFTLNNLGDVAQILGDHDQARGLFIESLDLARQLGFKHVIAGAVGSLGTDAHARGDFVHAAELFEQSLALARDAGDVQNEVTSLSNLGGMTLRLGDHERAAEHYAGAVALARESDLKHGLASALHGWADLLVELGDLDGAAERLAEAIHLQEAMRDRPVIAKMIETAARLAVLSGEIDIAAQLLGAADAERDALVATRWPNEEADIAKTIEAGVLAVGVTEWDASRLRGRRLSLEEAVSLASLALTGALRKP